MLSDGTWRALTRIADIIGIAWALATLGHLGYFANRGIQVVRYGG
jgi:hypothetical protein